MEEIQIPEPVAPEPSPPEPAPAAEPMPVAELKPAEPAPAAAEKNGLLFKLSEPLTSNGKTLDALSLDFDKLRVKGLKAVAVQFRAHVKEWIAVNWGDERYQLMCIARLNGIIYEDLDNVGGADGVYIMSSARNFFVDKEK